MEKGLREQLQTRADAQGISLNELINDLLINAIDAPHPITEIKNELAELKRAQLEILNLLQGKDLG